MQAGQSLLAKESLSKAQNFFNKETAALEKINVVGKKLTNADFEVAEDHHKKIINAIATYEIDKFIKAKEDSIQQRYNGALEHLKGIFEEFETIPVEGRKYSDSIYLSAFYGAAESLTSFISEQLEKALKKN
jgi:hypothetical protein